MFVCGFTLNEAENSGALATQLRKLADAVEAGRLSGACIDGNGNRIGTYRTAPAGDDLLAVRAVDNGSVLLDERVSAKRAKSMTHSEVHYRIDSRQQFMLPGDYFMDDDTLVVYVGNLPEDG